MVRRQIYDLNKRDQTDADCKQPGNGNKKEDNASK